MALSPPNPKRNGAPRRPGGTKRYSTFDGHPDDSKDLKAERTLLDSASRIVTQRVWQNSPPYCGSPNHTAASYLVWIFIAG